MSALSPLSESCQRVFIHLRVSYFTRWGERVVIFGEGALLGNWECAKGYSLSCHHEGDDLVWETIISVTYPGDVVYKYAVLTEANRVLKVDTETRRVVLPKGMEDGMVVKVFDAWQDTSNPNYILSRSAFNVIFNRQECGSARGPTSLSGSTARASFPFKEVGADAVLVRFRIWDWALQEGQRVAVLGSIPQLGCGLLSQALSMMAVEMPCWQAEVSVALSAFPFTYNYVIFDDKGGVERETGPARTLSMASAGDPLDEPASVCVRNDAYFCHQQLWRGAAVAVPVFSLRTTRSLGVGDFLDIKMLVDLCAKTGLHMIQLLPVNDTRVYGNWWDSYPYSSLSVFALHPLYLAVDKMMDPLPPSIEREWRERRAALDPLLDVDYEAVLKSKLDIAEKIFDECGEAVMQSDAFKDFFAANRDWLQPFAAFCFLKDLFGTSEHWQWGIAGQPTPALLRRVTNRQAPHYRSIALTYFMQYHLHCQLSEVSRYAVQHRVALKGDLPIGVDKRSVDTWMHPRLFRMNVSTGAPPDYFDPNGQNWGFPTYNWDEMERDGYLWWKQRLQHMAQYFHAYRIDHILGFFRIWEIPGDCATGLLGHFRPSQPLWKHELEARGLWDMDRLCEPYVTLSGLKDMLGELAYEAAGRYFQESYPPRLKLREQYKSEIAISGISARAGSPDWLEEETKLMRKALLTCRQNVVLLRDPEDDDKFYPRIALTTTGSFSELPPAWQSMLAELHDDYFFRRQNELWREHALKTLPVLIGCTDMLVCGEDLGMIPDCVHPVMKELGIIGLRIQRMSSEDGEEFGDPARYPYMVVASPSCHDISNIRAWWEEDADRRQRFFSHVLGGRGPAPDSCPSWVLRAILEQHCLSPAMWLICSLQDLMGLMPRYCDRPAEQETINKPTNTKHYWRYRVQVCLEDLLADDELVSEIRTLTRESGRNQPEDPRTADGDVSFSAHVPQQPTTPLANGACTDGPAFAPV